MLVLTKGIIIFVIVNASLILYFSTAVRLQRLFQGKFTVNRAWDCTMLLSHIPALDGQGDLSIRRIKSSRGRQVSNIHW